MRPIAILALACLLLAACSPSTPADNASAPPHLNAPADRVSYFGAWGFSIVFPADPTFSRGTEAHPTSLSADADVGGDNFAAAAAPYDLGGRSVDDAARSLAAVVMQKLGGTIASDEPVTSGKWTGREIQFAKDGQVVNVMRVFVANGRIYELGVTTQSGPDDPAIKRFMDSLVLLDPPAPHP